jgi:hypothetical protein
MLNVSEGLEHAVKRRNDLVGNSYCGHRLLLSWRSKVLMDDPARAMVFVSATAIGPRFPAGATAALLFADDPWVVTAT